jgi:hypothetical protein
VLDAANVDATAGEDPLFCGAEVVADDGDDADLREVAGGEREMSRRATEATIPAAGRGFKGIERDTAYNKNCHAANFPRLP